MSLFNSTNLIDAVHNESALWDTTANFSEEEKELAWQRIATLFGLPTGMYIVADYSTVFAM